ncbi:hypothetical protein [Natronosalvus rutilus]|uniref:Uncharacterized protein n=1 Tax=Natronosalvus rutilus TaxID=2953753 RepID=A0A9E7NBZ3_9EURY|nr:hypothetical protein [Natronosalvus rutilus]UTF54140.1 hypothetical protein NGM29_02325 [Natronosalvus rutilus]
MWWADSVFAFRFVGEHTATSIVRRYHRQRIRLQTWWTCGRHYAAPIDPSRVVDIAPDRIRYALEPRQRSSLESKSPTHVPAVVPGTWDLESARVREIDRYRRIVQWFTDEGRPSSARAGEPLAVAADGGPRPGGGQGANPRALPVLERTVPSGDRSALEWYLADLATRGCPRISARRDERSTVLEAGSVVDPYPSFPAATGEIRVDVGRDGRWILHDGLERLAVAQFLGLETIPVHVYVRHRRWQRRRDRVVLTGVDAGNHPDLPDLDSRSESRPEGSVGGHKWAR